MGGLGIPHPDETIQGFRQNLIQKIYRQYRLQPAAYLPAILSQMSVRLTSFNKVTQPDFFQWIIPTQIEDCSQCGIGPNDPGF